jgi:hypothetical protein
MTPNQMIQRKRIEVADAINRLADLDIVMRDTANRVIAHTDWLDYEPDNQAALFALTDMMQQIRDYCEHSERPECPLPCGCPATAAGIHLITCYQSIDRAERARREPVDIHVTTLGIDADADAVLARTLAAKREALAPVQEFQVDDLVTFNGAGEPAGGVSGLRVTDVKLVECNSIPSYWRVTASDGKGAVYEGAARFWTKDSGRSDSKKGEHNATL